MRLGDLGEVWVPLSCFRSLAVVGSSDTAVMPRLWVQELTSQMHLQIMLCVSACVGRVALWQFLPVLV